MEWSTRKRGRSCNHWQLQEEIDESSTLSSDQLERTSDKLYKQACKAGHRSTLRSCVFSFWHRSSVYVRLSALLRGEVKPLCVCLRLREQCLRSMKTSVARVAHVLLVRSVVGNMEVNTPASKRSGLIRNAAIVQKHRVIDKKSTCVCLRLPVATIYTETQECKVDLWPA